MTRALLALALLAGCTCQAAAPTPPPATTAAPPVVVQAPTNQDCVAAVASLPTACHDKLLALCSQQAAAQRVRSEAPPINCMLGAGDDCAAAEACSPIPLNQAPAQPSTE